MDAVDTSGPSGTLALLQLVAVCGVIGLLTLLTNWFMQRRGKENDENEREPTTLEPENEDTTPKVSPKPGKGKTKPSKAQAKVNASNTKFEHADLLSTLKNHTGTIVDVSFSTNGKYLVTVGEERAIILWSTKELGTASTGSRNTIRGKVDLDNPVSIDFGPDSKSVAIGLELSNTVKVMKIAKKDDSANAPLSFQDVICFPQILENEMLTCLISPSQTYVMVADNKDTVYVLDLKGMVLAKIDAKCGGGITHCVVSPCGRFIAYCGYNPELPIMEVEFSSTNVFRGINKAMLLKGHTSQITHFAFSQDAVSVATVARDKTWRVSNIDVRYKDQEAAKLVSKGEVGDDMELDNLKCFLSCNGKLIGVYDTQMLKLISVTSGDVLQSYTGFGSAPIIMCVTDNVSKMILVVAGKAMYVFGNKYQHVATLQWLNAETDKPGCTSAIKSRLDQQKQQEQEKLDAYEPKP